MFIITMLMGFLNLAWLLFFNIYIFFYFSFSLYFIDRVARKCFCGYHMTYTKESFKKEMRVYACAYHIFLQHLSSYTHKHTHIHSEGPFSCYIMQLIKTQFSDFVLVDDIWQTLRITFYNILEISLCTYLYIQKTSFEYILHHLL